MSDPPIGEHRLLGNRYGTALVRHDGTVDWWCAPGLDSPPLMWGLLDAEGPVAAWTGAVAVGRTSTVAGPGCAPPSPSTASSSKPVGRGQAHRRRWFRRRRRWRRAHRAVRKRLLATIQPDGTVPQTYGDGHHHDASALLLVIYGLVDGGDPRAAAVVDNTIAALGEGPFLRRYDPGVDDGFSPGEGAFVPCSWWAVSALAMVGRLGRGGGPR